MDDSHRDHPDGERPRRAPSSSDLFREAREQVDIRAVCRSLKDRITALQLVKLDPNGNLKARPAYKQDGPDADGWWMTCINPLHDDTSPSMSVSTSRNRWRCFGCDLVDMVDGRTARDNEAKSGSTIDLVKAVVLCEALAVEHKSAAAALRGITATEIRDVDARDYVLGVGRDGGALAPRSRPAAAPTVDRVPLSTEVLRALLQRERGMRAEGWQPEGFWRWQVSRGQLPTDELGHVVWFGGEAGYRFLRERFDDAMLAQAGFISARGRDFLAGCGALFVFRDADGTPVWAQGLRLPSANQALGALLRLEKVAVAAGQPDPLRITGQEDHEDLVRLAAQARAAAVARAKEPRMPKYLGLATPDPGWPFGSDRAAVGSRGGDGTLVLCEGVPDALVARRYAECALGFAGTGAVSMPADRWRRLLVDEAGAPKWRRVALAFDTDDAGQRAGRQVAEQLAVAGIPLWGSAQAAQRLASGETPSPGDRDAAIVLERWSTIGKDLSDSRSLG